MFKMTKHAFHQLQVRYNMSYDEVLEFANNLQQSDLVVSYTQEDGTQRAVTNTGVSLVIDGTQIVTALDKVSGAEYWCSSDYKQQKRKFDKSRFKTKKCGATTKRDRKWK